MVNLLNIILHQTTEKAKKECKFCKATAAWSCLLLLSNSRNNFLATTYHPYLPSLYNLKTLTFTNFQLQGWKDDGYGGKVWVDNSDDSPDYSDIAIRGVDLDDRGRRRRAADLQGENLMFWNRAQHFFG